MKKLNHEFKGPAHRGARCSQILKTKSGLKFCESPKSAHAMTRKRSKPRVWKAVAWSKADGDGFKTTRTKCDGVLRPVGVWGQKEAQEMDYDLPVRITMTEILPPRVAAGRRKKP